MGLLDLLGFGRKPWKDTDAKKRLAGVQDVPRSDQGVLLSLATQDSDSLVRQAAARRLKKSSHLEKLLNSKDAEVAGIARERLAGVAVAEIKRRPLSEAAPYLSAVTEQSSLVEISLQAEDAAVQEKAFEKLCAQEDPSAALLARIAIQHANETMALTATSHISKRGSLKDISKKAKSAAVRTAAAEKIKDIISEQEKPSAEKQRRLRKKELQVIFDRVQILAGSTRFDEVAAEVESCQTQWKTCDATYTDISKDEVTTALYDAFERAVQRFATRRQESADEVALLESSRTALEACCESWRTCVSENSESKADQDALDVLRTEADTEWNAIDGHALHPDLEKIFAQLFVAVSSSSHAVEAELSDLETQGQDTGRPAVELSAEDTAKVETVLTEAEGLVTAEDWREADYRFKEIHKIWSNLTIDLDFKDPLRTRFHDSYVAFKNACFERREKRRADQDQRIEVMNALVAEAQTMAEEGSEGIDLHQRWEAIQDIQQRWKDVGSVPHGKVRPLRNAFRAFCDTAYLPLREQREADAWKGFANVHLAEELIEKVQALLERDDSEQMLIDVKAVQQEWRTIKRLPKEKNEELWGRFKATADQVFEKLQPYFAERDIERVQHYERKQELLTEIQALSAEDKESRRGDEDKEARQVRSERIKAIQQEWKDVGPVPREKDKEQWQAYRAALDDFFGRRRKEYEGIAEEQTENLHQKLALMAEASDLAEDAEAWKRGERDDLRENDILRMIKELQQSWKTIGYIPKDKVEDLWKRFRGYCDRVFTCLKDYFDAMDVERKENLEKKRALLEKIKVHSEAEDPSEHREAVKAIQAIWRTVGYIPREAMEEVNSQYQAYCDIIFNVSRTVQPLVQSEPVAVEAQEAAEEIETAAIVVEEAASPAEVATPSAEAKEL